MKLYSLFAAALSRDVELLADHECRRWLFVWTSQFGGPSRSSWDDADPPTPPNKVEVHRGAHIFS